MIMVMHVELRFLRGHRRPPPPLLTSRQEEMQSKCGCKRLAAWFWMLWLQAFQLNLHSEQMVLDPDAFTVFTFTYLVSDFLQLSSQLVSFSLFLADFSFELFQL